MVVNRDKCIQSLTAISAHPTAPFYEYRVTRYILAELERLGLAVGRDEYGNIIAEYVGPDAPENGVALVAHMDHPGFDLANDEGTQAWLLGHVHKDCFAQPVPVRVFPAMPSDDEQEQGVCGTITGVAESPDSRVLLNLEMSHTPPSLPAFGMWDFPQIEIRDDLAHMRAIDDTVGCATILMVLEELVQRQTPCRCYGVFTRAEEVGFFGAIGLVQEKVLPMDTIMVSLETSKQLPGAEMGKGPVIRVGDRLTTFDRKGEMMLQSAAKVMSGENPEARVQRQLMSGGACEGTIFALGDYCTTAMAIPLGNYHNMTPEMTLAPEYISLNDLATEVELLVRAMEYILVDATEAAGVYSRATPHLDRLKSTFAAWKP